MQELTGSVVGFSRLWHSFFCVCIEGADLVRGGFFPAVIRAAGCISIVVRRQSAAVAVYDNVANELSCAE